MTNLMKIALLALILATQVACSDETITTDTPSGENLPAYELNVIYKGENLIIEDESILIRAILIMAEIDENRIVNLAFTLEGLEECAQKGLSIEVIFPDGMEQKTADGTDVITVKKMRIIEKDSKHYSIVTLEKKSATSLVESSEMEDIYTILNISK